MIDASQLLPELRRLRADAEAACVEAATRKRHYSGDAINWGNLRCVEALFVVSDNDGAMRYQARVEEASPSCVKLPRWIEGRLRERGWYAVEVLTEW